MKTLKSTLLGFQNAGIIFWSLFGLMTCTHLGCNKTQPATTASTGTSGFQENLVEIPDPEPTPQEIWNWLIDAAARGESASISMPEKVSTAMLEQLKQTPAIVELLLDFGVVEDSGIALIVKSCPDIEHFRARLSPITDEGGKELAKLSKLRLINLPQGKVSAPSIQAWQQLSQLNHLRLGGKQIDDNALAEIVKLPELQSLHLIGPSLTDEGLQQLTAAKKLSSFYIDDCPLSETAWVKLKKTRPDLHIHVDQVHPDR